MSSFKFIVWLLRAACFVFPMQWRNVIAEKWSPRTHTQAHLTEHFPHRHFGTFACKEQCWSMKVWKAPLQRRCRPLAWKTGRWGQCRGIWPLGPERGLELHHKQGCLCFKLIAVLSSSVTTARMTTPTHQPGSDHQWQEHIVSWCTKWKRSSFPPPSVSVIKSDWISGWKLAMGWR